MKRFIREEFMKSARDELCATLKHGLDVMRKYHKRLTMEALGSMKDCYKDGI